MLTKFFLIQKHWKVAYQNLCHFKIFTIFEKKKTPRRFLKMVGEYGPRSNFNQSFSGRHKFSDWFILIAFAGIISFSNNVFRTLDIFHGR